MRMNWSKFTKQTRAALENTTYYALKYPSQDMVRPEHIFVSMMDHSESDAFLILSKMDHFVTPDMLRAEVIATFPKTADPKIEAKKKVEYTLSPEGKKIFKYATSEAKKSRLGYIDTRHILIGMVQTESTDVHKIFLKHGITLEKIYASPHKAKERVVMETWVKAVYFVAFLIVIIFFLVNYYFL